MSEEIDEIGLAVMWDKITKTYGSADIAGPDTDGTYFVAIHLGDGVHQKVGTGVGRSGAICDAYSNLPKPVPESETAGGESSNTEAQKTRIAHESDPVTESTHGRPATLSLPPEQPICGVIGRKGLPCGIKRYDHPGDHIAFENGMPVDHWLKYVPTPEGKDGNNHICEVTEMVAPAAESEGQEKDAKARLREFTPDPTEWMNTIRGLLFTLGMREEMSNWSGHFDGWGAAFEWIKYHVKRSQGLAKTEATGKAEGVELPPLDVTPDDWLASAKKLGSMLRNNEDRAAIACRERQLLAALAQISSLQRELEETRKGGERLLEAINWACGCDGDFNAPSDARFWWRTPLVKKANLTYDKSVQKYVPLPSPPEPAKKEEASKLLPTTPPIVSMPMQGVDRPECEGGTPHTHAAEGVQQN